NEDYDAGTVIVEVRPGATAASPAEVTVVPATSYVRIDNDATTTASGDTTISVEREHGTNTIVVSGSIPLDASVDRNWATVDEPTGYAADVFRKALARHGVRVTGKTTYAATPSSARELAAHRSMTVGELLVPFMKLSNNMHAEHLVKEMGRKAAGEGSWDAGIDAMFDALESFGVQRDRIRLADGSGLSRWDLVSARQVANLLTVARGKPWFRTWYDSLPVAGIDDRWIGGTLRSRMRGTPAEGNVHAKTGTLTGATGLSGYVTDADGEPLVFSVIHNNHIGAVNPKSTEDLIATRLAGFTRNPQSADTAPTRPRLPRTDYGPADVECSWVKAC
ncbi:MAG TPA: D-alanyl-D-alanine carboxypeptidase/D-alanyl-D-alanine-endopeptidase, partial [Actinopolymorphaceae bacterium]